MTTATSSGMSGMRRQRGVALLMTLIIMALTATIAFGMAWDISLDLHRTANLLHADQAKEYALGAEAWSEQILRRDAEQQAQQDLQNKGTNPDSGASGTSNGTSVNLTQDWAMQLPPLPVQGGTVTGRIQDLQGLFNINSLVNANPTPQDSQFGQLQRLLTALNLDPGLAAAIYDWVNVGDQPHFPGGAKDETYSRLQPPYFTAERPMTSITELLLVNGITPQVFRKLEPYVCALPPAPQSTGVTGDDSNQNPNPRDRTRSPLAPGMPAQVHTINVNTAPPIVLMSLERNIDLATATAIAQNLATHPIESNGQLQAIWAQLTNGQRIPGNAGVTSNYFRLTVNVKIGSTQLTMYSLLYRTSPSGGTYAIRRTFGTL